MNINIWILILMLKGNTPTQVEFLSAAACQNAQLELSANWEAAKRIGAAVCVPKYVPPPIVVR